MAAPRQARAPTPEESASRREIWSFYFPQEWNVDCPLGCEGTITPFDFDIAPRGIAPILSPPNKGEAYVPVCRACRKKLRGVTVHEYIVQHKLAEPYGCRAPHPHIDDVVFNLGMIPIDQLIADSRTLPALDRAIAEYNRLLWDSTRKFGEETLDLRTDVGGKYAHHTLRTFMRLRCNVSRGDPLDYYLTDGPHLGEDLMRRLFRYLKDPTDSRDQVSRYTVEHLDRDLLRFLNNRISEMHQFLRAKITADYTLKRAWYDATGCI